MKVIICGGRDFKHPDLLYEKCDIILQHCADIEVVSGGASGADYIGEQYAKSRGFKLKVFHAEWEKYGKSAGHLRNTSMSLYADGCIAFWDGASRGTKDMIQQAKDHGLKTRTILYK